MTREEMWLQLATLSDQEIAKIYSQYFPTPTSEEENTSETEKEEIDPSVESNSEKRVIISSSGV